MSLNKIEVDDSNPQQQHLYCNKGEGVIVGKQKSFDSLQHQQETIQNKLYYNQPSISLTQEQRNAAEVQLNKRLNQGKFKITEDEKQPGSTALIPDHMQAEYKAEEMKRFDPKNMQSSAKKQSAARKRGGSASNQNPKTDEMKQMEFLSILERKADIPEIYYKKQSSIPNRSDSPNKDIYEQIDNRMLGIKEEETKANVKLYAYQKAGVGEIGRRQSAVLEDHMKIKPMADSVLMGTPQPYIHGVGTKQLERANMEFYNRDFHDREMHTKTHGLLKQVATEETLDDWYAQSIGVDYEKLLRQKKILRQSAHAKQHEHGGDDHHHHHAHEVHAKEVDVSGQAPAADGAKDSVKTKKQRLKSSYQANFVKNNPLTVVKRAQRAGARKEAESCTASHRLDYTGAGNKVNLSTLVQHLKKPTKIEKPQDIKLFVLPGRLKAQSDVVKGRLHDHHHHGHGHKRPAGKSSAAGGHQHGHGHEHKTKQEHGNHHGSPKRRGSVSPDRAKESPPGKEQVTAAKLITTHRTAKTAESDTERVRRFKQAQKEEQEHQEMLQRIRRKVDTCMKEGQVPDYWTQDGRARSELLRDLGGFNKRQLLRSFFQQMLEREEKRKREPQELQGPDEAFIAKQKQKLRDLMFKNSELERQAVAKKEQARLNKQEQKLPQKDSISQQQGSAHAKMLVKTTNVSVLDYAGGAPADDGTGYLVHVNANGDVGGQDYTREPSVMMEAKSVALFTKQRSNSTVTGVGVERYRASSTNPFISQNRRHVMAPISTKSAYRRRSNDSNRSNQSGRESPKTAQPQLTRSQIELNEKRKSLQRFWITGCIPDQQPLSAGVTGNSTVANSHQVTMSPTEQPISPQTTLFQVKSDNSQKWHLRQSSDAHIQLNRKPMSLDMGRLQDDAIAVAQNQFTVEKQRSELRVQTRLPDKMRQYCERAYVELYQHEQQFFNVNKNLKGFQMSSQFHKQLLRQQQEDCFVKQKKDMITDMLKKKDIGDEKYKKSEPYRQAMAAQRRRAKLLQRRLAQQNGTSLESESIEISHTSQIESVDISQKEVVRTHQSRMSATFDEREIPQNDAQRHAWVLKQVELDNLRDIEEPFVFLNVDKRVNKLDIRPKTVEPTESMMNAKVGFQDAAFWYFKGCESGKAGEMDSAIDSYRQAIRLDTTQYQSMINMAAQYEHQQRFEIACKWYKIAMLLQPDQLESYYGFALCKFKDGKPADAVEHLTIALDKLGGADLHPKKGKHLIHYRYLRSLSYRVMQEFKKSQKDYRDILRSFELEEGSQFAKYIFAMILMPLETNRRKLLKYVEGFRGVIELYEPDKDRRILSTYYLQYLDKNDQYILRQNQHPKWLDKKIYTIVDQLSRRSFFKRFKIPLIREMIDVMDLNLVQKNDILFFRPEKVYVIVSGNILMKNHEGNILLPTTCAKFGEGDILNFMQEDSALFNSLETWYFAQVQTEVAIFDREYFNNIWREHIMTQDLMLKRSVLAAQPLFSELSDLTAWMLVSEVIQVRKYTKGQIIMPMSKFAPTNSFFRKFYDSRSNKFTDMMKEQRLKGNATCGACQDPPEKVKKQQVTPEITEEDLDDPKLKHQKTLSKYNLKASASSLKMKPTPSKSAASIHEEEESSDFDFDEPDKHNKDCQQSKKHQSQLNQSSAMQSEEPALHPSVERANRLYRQLTLKKDTQGGLYVIINGYAWVRNTDDQYNAKRLRQGDFFGESDILKTVGYTFFGEIVADSDDLEVHFIPADQFWKIPLFEQVFMKQHSKERKDIIMLTMNYCKRYSLDAKEYASYFGD